MGEHLTNTSNTPICKTSADPSEKPTSQEKMHDNLPDGTRIGTGAADAAKLPATKLTRAEKQSMDSSVKLTELPEASAPAGHGARNVTTQKALNPSSQLGTVQSNTNDESTNQIPRIPIIAVGRPTAILAIFLILVMWFAVGYLIGRRVGLCRSRRPPVPNVKFADNSTDPETAVPWNPYSVVPRNTRLSDVQPEHAVA